MRAKVMRCLEAFKSKEQGPKLISIYTLLESQLEQYNRGLPSVNQLKFAGSYLWNRDSINQFRRAETGWYPRSTIYNQQSGQTVIIVKRPISSLRLRKSKLCNSSHHPLTLTSQTSGAFPKTAGGAGTVPPPLLLLICFAT